MLFGEPPYGRLPGSEDPIDWGAFFLETRQRHHDLFLRWLYEGRFKPGDIDIANVEAAIEREWAGQVEPLGSRVPRGKEASKN